MAIISKQPKNGPRQRKLKRSGMDHVNRLYNPKESRAKSDKYFEELIQAEKNKIRKEKNKEIYTGSGNDLRILDDLLSEELSPVCQNALKEGSVEHSKHIKRCESIKTLSEKHPVYKQFVDDYRANKGSRFEIKLQIKDYLKLITND